MNILKTICQHLKNPSKDTKPQWELDFERQFYHRGLFELDYDGENLIDVYDEVLQFIRSIKK